MQSRQDLLDATKRLVAAEGARATTVARITAEAGLAKGLFFYYFKSKDAALSAITAEIEGSYMQGLESAAGLAPPPERLAAIFVHHFRFIDECQQDALFLHAVSVDCVAGGVEVVGGRGGPSLGFYEHLFMAILDTLESGVRSGDFICSDTDEMAFMILGAIHGLARLKLSGFRRDYDVVSHLVAFYGKALGHHA
jgi:AcrR family transcriptional regulator